MICPKCKGEATPTDWKPPFGYDPQLVKYKCANGHVFYARTRRLLEAKKLSKGGC